MGPANWPNEWTVSRTSQPKARKGGGKGQGGKRGGKGRGWGQPVVSGGKIAKGDRAEERGKEKEKKKERRVKMDGRKEGKGERKGGRGGSNANRPDCYENVADRGESLAGEREVSNRCQGRGRL